MQTADELLLIGDVCRVLEGTMSADGVRKASDRGDLPVAQRTPSGVRLYRLSDVEHFKALRDAKDGRRR